jgi:hypothetical protein
MSGVIVVSDKKIQFKTKLNWWTQFSILVTMFI